MTAYATDVPRPRSQRPDRVAVPDIGSGQAERLRRSRKAKSYSLHDLAAASGVAAKTILAIEQGSKGTASCLTMAKLADALGVPRGWLAFGG